VFYHARGASGGRGRFGDLERPRARLVLARADRPRDGADLERARERVRTFGYACCVVVTRARLACSIRVTVTVRLSLRGWRRTLIG
jgi:hypothetical protein